MADMGLIQAAVSGLNTAGQIAKGFLQLHNLSEVQGKVIELQSVIMGAQGSALAAQSEQSALIERIRELEQELVRVKAWEAQKQRYKLLAPWRGAVVYGLKESMAAGEQAHWICTHCYEDGRRSILHPIYPPKGMGGHLACPKCKGEVHYSYNGKLPEPKYSPNGFNEVPPPPVSETEQAPEPPNHNAP